jgi:N-succinyldiaminopimelate aminotransferase
MNPDLARLQPYPFEKLARLKAGIEPPADHDPITLAIGEPKHSPPQFVAEELLSHLHGLASYPSTKGSAALRQAITDWLYRRFHLPSGSLDAERHILPVNGTREALFAIAQCVIDRRRPARVLMPNPFYQIYEGAALLAGAEPYFLNTTEDTDLAPDFDAVPESVWQDCQLLYLCTPGNPTGAVIAEDTLQGLIGLAERHDFIIASDECYSEIYFDEAQPPVGLLQAAAAMGNDAYRRCLVFHSLSKRSNLPGMRSGFVAGDADIIAAFFQYRTYHGCSMAPYTQAASISAWHDEQHVRENRHYYQQKFTAVLDILAPVMAISRPDAGFYLWPRTAVDDTVFARELYARHNVTVLPGSYLSRDAHGGNPGSFHIRIALVAEQDECVAAAERIRALCESL